MINRVSLIILIVVLSAVKSFSQNKLVVSRVYLDEKQNKPAKAIPKILLEAYSKSDIKAHYPKDWRIEVPYMQFLNHFGMATKAQNLVASNSPYWFCRKPKQIPVDSDVLNCMQYSFEIGEQVSRNRITYEQEVKIVYVKLIYSDQCSADSIEKEGPVFKMQDIAKLRGSGYRIVNYNNPSVTYSVEEYLKLRLFNAR